MATPSVEIGTDSSMPQQPIEIVVYRITGRQGLIDIPHRYCEECDLTIIVARQVVDELGDPDVRLVVRPWLLWFWRPIWRGGWHAPIVTVDGWIVSQGVVPARETLLRAIEHARRRAVAVGVEP